MSAYAVSLITPPEGGARGSHLPAHVGRGAGDLSQAWSSQIRRSGDLRASFAAVDGSLRRLRERDGANVRSSGITLKTLVCNVRRHVLQESTSGRSADPSPSITRNSRVYGHRQRPVSQSVQHGEGFPCRLTVSPPRGNCAAPVPHTALGSDFNQPPCARPTQRKARRWMGAA